MIDHVLRKPKQILFTPLAKNLPVTPNTLTLWAFAAGLLSAFLAAVSLTKWALGFWLLNRVLDGLDGEVARAQDSQTDLGGYLDMMADLTVYALVPLGLAFSKSQPGVWLALALMLTSFYINAGSWMYLSSIFEKRGRGSQESGETTTITMPRGLVEGAETALFFTLFFIGEVYLVYLFSLFALLTLAGAILRIRWACGELG